MELCNSNVPATGVQEPPNCCEKTAGRKKDAAGNTGCGGFPGWMIRELGREKFIKDVVVVGKGTQWETKVNVSSDTIAWKQMALAIEKVTASGNDRVIVTERGTSFGYHNLVVDMRSLGRMKALGFPVVFDATHSVQLPSAGERESSGEREHVALLARAATAAGIDGIFLETHPRPEAALCDAASQWPLDAFESLLATLQELHAVRTGGRRLV